MVFSSPVFLFLFLPALLLVYYFANERLRNGVLLVFSLLFYAWGEPKNVAVMVASILVNYGLGLGIAKFRKRKKLLLALAVTFDIGVLFVFKYLNFAADTFCAVTGAQNSIARIALPIGISFYTFQILSYVIDVYRGQVKEQRNLLRLALYVSLFPQLIAGPIVRYADVEEQIGRRTVTKADLAEGFLRFARGFAKKILIADQVAVLADKAFSGAYPSVPLYWAGIVAYALQIYFDFSGYSDMAIGLGRLFGFRFMENFNFPYIARSVQEFWRRWHISLSTWFRDYLYIPLGGNRKGKGRTYLNLLIVFLATGLWHGASFNFLLWGLYYAVFLILERVWLGKRLEKIPKVFRHVYTVLVVLIGWVLFRADDLPGAAAYLKGMFVPAGKDWATFLYVMDRQYWFCLIVGILLSIPWVKKLGEKTSGKPVWTALGRAAVIGCFLVAICYMVGSGFSPFLYFRF